MLTLTLQKSRNIHDPMKRPKLECIAYNLAIIHNSEKKTDLYLKCYHINDFVGV